MKFNNVSFPHPVLGVDDAISGNIGFVEEPEIIPRTDTYSISIKCKHDNEDFNKLISENQAEYYCEATCSNTLFRQIFRNNVNEINIEIPKKHVKGKVEFTCILVTKTNITNYKNNKIHPDYNGYKFDLDEGDILGFFGEFNFNADINYEKLKAVSTFMEVVENEDPEAIFTNIDINKNKIEVQLPSKDYQIFSSDSISKDSKFSSIFHSSIVLNSLLMALYNFEDHKEKLWAQAIDYRLKNEKIFEGLSIQEKENIPEIAQKLLGNPFYRLLNSLKFIVDSTTENE